MRAWKAKDHRKGAKGAKGEENRIEKYGFRFLTMKSMKNMKTSQPVLMSVTVKNHALVTERKTATHLTGIFRSSLGASL